MFAQMFETLGHLPVAEIAADVAESVLGGTVTIVASATGSGKSLLLPAALAFTGDEQVVVLVPRRFLAVNAAETVCDLSGLTVGEEVGYALGTQAGEDSRISGMTKVFYCTYGYAIASGLINRARRIALDEVHEASMDMSICRALLHMRLAKGERVDILEMSATINATRQAAYWNDVTRSRVMEIDGRTFACERRHRPASRPEEEVKNLLDEGRTGILVFRPGRGEVEETAAAIRALAGADVEVAEIYGELDYVARKQAVAAPQGKAKVLVGTNVVESGVNIPWFDAGVSCGTGKEISVRPETGATFLGLIDLPRWRLEQQEGRIKRFREGIFVLCAEKSHDQREAETTPEIKRLPLTELVMHCAGFGIRAEELVFDYAPAQARIIDAETQLQRLGLLDVDCRLTKAGQWASNLPVGPETGAMLWFAQERDLLSATLPLAVMIEVDGIRKDFREPHGLNSSSDWLDSLQAFQAVLAQEDSASRKRAMERWNVSFKRLEAAKELLHDLKRRLHVDEEATATNAQLKLCLLAGFSLNLFSGWQQAMKQVTSNQQSSYSLGNGSSAILTGGFALGRLRTIQPRDTRKQPFTIVEKVTDVTLDEILEVAKIRPHLVSRDIRRSRVGSDARKMLETTTYKLFGSHMLTETKRMVSPTAAEDAETQRLEAQRIALIKRLQRLNSRRRENGLRDLVLDKATFSMTTFGTALAYTEENVAKAERDSYTTIDAKRTALHQMDELVAAAPLKEPSPFDRLRKLIKR